jgi:hypothetical protein
MLGPREFSPDELVRGRSAVGHDGVVGGVDAGAYLVGAKAEE